LEVYGVCTPGKVHVIGVCKLKKALAYGFRTTLAALLVVAMVIGVLRPVSVSAIADPTTAPAVNAVYGFTFSDGSVGFLVDYTLNYAVLPTETATASYLVVFIDTDGTTQLRSVAPYAFHTLGYGRGTAWISFSAAEVATLNITSANITNYRVWLTGNPTLTWATNPPKTIAGVDSWTTTSADGMLALRVLYYADSFELAWSIDMIQSTALGNRLTTTGESYFDNVITGLRTLAPDAYANTSVLPGQNGIDYTTSFGAVAAGAIISGSPVTMTSGINTLNATGTGVFTITLANGTTGNITNGTGNMSSYPEDLTAGTNTVTVTANGTLIARVALVNTQTLMDTSTSGTGLDASPTAALFGIPTGAMTTFIWVIFGVVVAAAAAFGITRSDIPSTGSGVGGAATLVFGIWIVGGGLIGVVDTTFIAGILMACGAYVGYILFFKSGGDIGRTVMFLAFMLIVTAMAGGIVEGYSPIASTTLTADITTASTTINVASTTGFNGHGIIVIGNERIVYPKKNATQFIDAGLQGVVRGASGTEKQSHLAGSVVRQIETSMFNDTLDYNIALLADSAGSMAFITVPIALWTLLLQMITIPVAFIGTGSVWITMLWAVIGVGLLVSILIAVTGGRRI
jgi:hypothetical protein